jgi:hypothetical protein
MLGEKGPMELHRRQFCVTLPLPVTLTLNRASLLPESTLNALPFTLLSSSPSHCPPTPTPTPTHPPQKTHHLLPPSPTPPPPPPSLHIPLCALLSPHHGPRPHMPLARGPCRNGDFCDDWDIVLALPDPQDRRADFVAVTISSWVMLVITV